jgi:ABC-type branched-subunit amino acid transport system substrate-binding protein
MKIKTLLAAILFLFVGSLLVFAETGTKIQVGILFDGGATKPSPLWAQVPTFQMALEEINSAGVTVEVHMRNTRDVGANVAQYTQELIDKGVVYINGCQGSANAVVSAPIAVDAGVVYGGASPSTDVLSGCTQDVVQKGLPSSKMPAAGKCWKHGMYFFRTQCIASDWGRAGAIYAGTNENYSTLKTAAMLLRDDPFGRSLRDGFKEVFEAHGKSFLTSIEYPKGATHLNFKDLIPTLVAKNPDIVAGVWRIGELKEFLKAWAALEDAGMSTVKFIHLGSVRTDYADLDPTAINLLANRSVGIQPHYDPNSIGYQKWLRAFQAFDRKGKHIQGKPGYDTEMKVLDSSGNPLFRHALASYDAAIIYFLAMTKADTTDNKKIRKEILAVANPPGMKIYPGEFSKARDLIMLGKDIDYEGASSPVNLDKSGNVSGLPYLVWSVNSDGTKKDLEVFAP